MGLRDTPASQGFEKLMAQAGPPPAPLPDAPAQLPRPSTAALMADTGIPNVTDIQGYEGEPTTHFKVHWCHGRLYDGLLLSASQSLIRCARLSLYCVQCARVERPWRWRGWPRYVIVELNLLQSRLKEPQELLPYGPSSITIDRLFSTVVLYVD